MLKIRRYALQVHHGYYSINTFDELLKVGIITFTSQIIKTEVLRG